MLNSKNKSLCFPTYFISFEVQSISVCDCWVTGVHHRRVALSMEQVHQGVEHKKCFLLGEVFLTPQPKWLLGCLLKSMGTPHLFRRGICKVFFILSLFLLWWKKNPDVPGLGIFETFTFLFNWVWIPWQVHKLFE